MYHMVIAADVTASSDSSFPGFLGGSISAHLPHELLCVLQQLSGPIGRGQKLTLDVLVDDRYSGNDGSQDHA